MEQFLLAAALEPGKADDLALRAVRCRAPASPRHRRRCGLDGRRRKIRLRAQRPRHRSGFSAHHSHEIGDADVLRVAVPDQPAVSQHSDARRDVDDLEQFVAYEDEGDAFGRLSVDIGAQLLTALGPER